MSKIKVVVADDEQAVLSGICSIVKYAGDDFEVVGTAQNGEDALRLIEKTQADMLITDIRMPHMDGIALINELERRGTPIIAVIVSAYDDRHYIRTAIRSPIVYDYVMKPFHRSEMTELLHVCGEHSRRKQGETDRQSSSSIGEIVDAMRSGRDKQAQELFLQLWDAAGFENVMQAKLFAGDLLMRVGWSIKPSSNIRSTFFKTYTDMRELERLETSAEVKSRVLDFIASVAGALSSQVKITGLVASSLEIISERLADSSFGISEVAEKLEVTPNYLSSRFSRDMGVSFVKYLTLMRMERAKEFLENTNLKVYQISGEVGFEDSGYFDRVFKETVGVKPSEYRNYYVSLPRNGAAGEQK